MKAHSARVPGKNFRSFAGKPLFRWMLDTLLSIDAIDLLVINTDAREILEEQEIPGADRVCVRDRKPDLCGDYVSMNLVLADDVANVEAATYLMTHTTNPLLSPKTIGEALNAYYAGVANGSADSLFTVNRYQTRFYRQDGTPINHDPHELIRTQDLEPWFEENSNLYVFSAQSFRATSARIGSKPILFETPLEESHDIDDQNGWNIAERLAKTL